MKLRKDLVLVRLAPRRDTPKIEGIKSDLDTWLALTGIEESQRILRRPFVEACSGHVVQISPGTRDVWPGDYVVLDPEAGQLLDISDPGGNLVPHAIVSERGIACIVER